MKTIEQVIAIFEANNFTMSKSIAGQWRLFHFDQLIYEDPASEDLEDYEKAASLFYQFLQDTPLYDVYLAHDWTDEFKDRHYFCGYPSVCFDSEYFSHDEVRASLFKNEDDAKAVMAELNKIIDSEEIRGARLSVSQFELFEDVDE